MPDGALAGLDPEQRLVAEAVRGPVVVLAGAGTGKTRAITARIAHAVETGAHSANAGLAVTFTNRAAGEMRQRLAGLGVPGLAVRTFHSAALSQLRHFWPTTVGGPFPRLIASKAALVAQACGDLGLPTARPLVRDVAAEIEWAASSLVAAGGYVEAAAAAGRPPVGSGSEAIDLAGIARVLLAYQDLKQQSNTIDFEDVLLTLIAVLGDRPDIADEVRRRYRWFTVDEYQDITPAQDVLLASWLGERDDVCVVGDANQTIYAFAGARPDSLERFAARWTGATEVRLDRCYRCTPQIVSLANSVLRSAAEHPVFLRSQREDGPEPEVVACADDTEEAQSVVHRIRRLIDGGLNPGDIAVLMRTNAASEPFEVALAEAGVDYVMRGGERFFERPEVKEALVRLRGAALATPAPQPTLDAGDALVGQVEAVLAGMGWLATGPPSGGATRERWESLAAVLTLSREVAVSGRTTIAELLAEFDRRAELAHPPTADAVTITTLHAAKGLEWPAVFIVGAAEGGLPIVYADTPERIEEERRLFYVGLTRARDHLVVSWSLTRPGSGRHREASRFLAAARSQGRASAVASSAGLVRRGTAARSAPAARTAPAPRCRGCGVRLVGAESLTLGRCRTCPGDADATLLTDAQAWRSGVAREQGLPERAVLRDLTLQAIAERRPATEAELADIPEFRPEVVDLYGRSVLDLVARARATAGGTPTPA